MGVLAKKRRAGKKNGRLVALFGAVALLVASFGTPAHAVAEVGDTVWVGGAQGPAGTGFHPVYLETPADVANAGEPDFWAYCIENRLDARVNSVGQVDDPSGFLGSNFFTDPVVQGKVFWVLAHSYPALSLEEFGAAAGVPGISRNDAIEATQYAVWRYTDLSFDANWDWAGNDDPAATEAAYWHLIDGVNAGGSVTPSDFETTVSITAPTARQSAMSLVGPFLVQTNQPSVRVIVDPLITLTDSNGTVIDPTHVVDGQQIYLDLSDTASAGLATLTASALGSSTSGRIITFADFDGQGPSQEHHAQTMALIAAAGTTTTAQASARWSGAEAPVIGTTLTDLADGDHTLAHDGGTVTDTIAYRNLTPGIEYRLSGELMRKSDGSATGIVGSAVFTPSTADGTVDVTFTVPNGYAGEYLVAFEQLFETGAEGNDPVATHQDINDQAQTVYVDEAPVVSQPTPEANTGKLANTGAASSGLPVLGAGALLLAGCLVLIGTRRRA